MAASANAPVLIGPVPLFFVQSMTMNEGYRIERIMGSRFSQATQPSSKTIAIEATLVGPDRLRQKQLLEVTAALSRMLVASASPGSTEIGIPVVSGLTISTNMQITDLRFTQSVTKRDAIDVSVTLQEALPSRPSAEASQGANASPAAGSAGVPTGPAANPSPRLPGAPI
jgi:hypothetical protein